MVRAGRRRPHGTRHRDSGRGRTERNFTQTENSGGGVGGAAGTARREDQVAQRRRRTDRPGDRPEQPVADHS